MVGRLRREKEAVGRGGRRKAEVSAGGGGGRRGEEVVGYSLCAGRESLVVKAESLYRAGLKTEGKTEQPQRDGFLLLCGSARSFLTYNLPTLYRRHACSLVVKTS
ncbi:hypothetical protein R6Q59_036102 [Mikania micrantha]